MVEVLRPEGLFLDLVVLSVEDLDDPLVRDMLRDCRVLYDGLNIRDKLTCKS
ncbi:hypothetical protein [Vulcanisaeta thermophila]|uniref:hypothetical protein n=1 Tax=Vulcanisaeta thermophila TaxID=867917 RepID=UPI00138A4DBE|nr:hypothetical protein [Vulcanisaeta thermophila]